ncbi:hypothetical protein Tco_1465605 [Tanacetum coccineum]
MEGVGAVTFPFKSRLPMTDFERIPVENWVVGQESIQKVLNRVRPTYESEDKRRRVFEYLKRIIECRDPVIKVFPYGSVPLKTYLRVGDIDLTVIGDENIPFPGRVVDLLEIEKENENAEFKIQDIKCIFAEVKIIKCNVGGFLIDISWNQLGGLCSLCFLEQVDSLIGKDNLFKQSIILIKSWCNYESCIHGASSGFFSTYALETLILYIFIMYYDSLIDPLMVLYRFLEYYSRFDWERHCISLYGRVELSQLHNVTFETPVMLGEKSLNNYIDMFVVPSKKSETYMPFFQRKFINIIDPLKANNNLGRSVSTFNNFARMKIALRYGGRRLSEVMLLPSENLGDGIKNYFQNTLKANPLKFFETSTPSSVTVTVLSSNEDQSNWSNGYLDDSIPGMNGESTGKSSEESDSDLTPDEEEEKKEVAEELQNLLNKTFELELPPREENESLNIVNLSGDYANHIRNLASAKSFKGFDLNTAVADLLTNGGGAPSRPILSGQNAIEASGNSANMVRGTGSFVPITIRRGRGPGPAMPAHHVPSGSTNDAGPSTGPTHLRVPVFGSFGPVPTTRSTIFRAQEGPVRLGDDAQFPPLIPLSKEGVMHKV